MSGWCSRWFKCLGQATEAGTPALGPAASFCAQDKPAIQPVPEGSSKQNVAEPGLAGSASRASAPESRPAQASQARTVGKPGLSPQPSLRPAKQSLSGSHELEVPPQDKSLHAAHPGALSAAATAAVAAAAAFTQLHSLQPLHGELTQLTWLGSGTGGRVYSGLWRGTPVAVKIIVSRTPDEVRESMREAILGRVASHPHTVQCFASFSGYITEQDITPRSPDQGHELTPVSSAAALMHLDLDIASAAGNTGTSQAVTPTASSSIRHGAAGVAGAGATGAAAPSAGGGMKGAATGVSAASALLASSAATSPAGNGGGVPSAELPAPAAAAWPRQHSLQEQPASNTSTLSTHSSQTRNVLSQHQLQPLQEAAAAAAAAGAVAPRTSRGSRGRDADGAAAQHGNSMSGAMGGGVGRTSTDADTAACSSHSGGPRARLGRTLGQGADGAAAAASEHGGGGGGANTGMNTSTGSRSSSLRHSHLLARGAAELARLQHQQPGSQASSQQRGGGGGGGGGGSLGGPVSGGRGGSSRALRTMPVTGGVLMSHSAAGSTGAVMHGAAAAQLVGAAEDVATGTGVAAASAAGASTSASAFTRLSATGMALAMAAADSTAGAQSLATSAATGRRRSYSLARGTLVGATSASGGQASHGTLEHRSLSLVGLGSAAHAGQSRTTLTLSDLLLGLNGGDEGGHGGHGGGGAGGAGTYELWQVLAATGALPGRYCTLVVMEMCDQGTLLTKAQQRPYRAVRSAEAAGDLLALLRTALEVAQGMCHLHSLDIVHGDLKPSNVLLQSNAASLTLNGAAAGSRVLAGLTGGPAAAAAAAALAAAERERDVRGYTAKVADFGMASKVEGSSPRVLNAAAGEDAGAEVPVLGAAKERGWGSLAYLAPEVPEHGPTKKSDVWSFGMCLYFMCCGKVPYSHYASLRPAQMLVGIVEGSLTLDWPEDTYRLLRRLAETCCQRDPAARPPFSRIVPALQRLVRHICSHPEPSTSTASSAVSSAAGAGGQPGAAAAAATGGGRRRQERSRDTGGGSGTKGAASPNSSALVDVRQGQGHGRGQQHRQPHPHPHSPKAAAAAAVNSTTSGYSGTFDHGSSSIVNMELHPSPLQLFANCLTLPAAGSIGPGTPALGSAAGASSIPAFASSGGAAMPSLVGMGGDGAAAGRTAAGNPATAGAATLLHASAPGARGPSQSQLVSHNMYDRSAAAAAAVAAAGGAAAPTTTVAAAAAAAVMVARGEAAAVVAASHGAPADCSSSQCAADCSVGGCLDDSSLIYNTTQTFAETVQVCKTLDGSSYSLLPPPSALPTASASVAASATPPFHAHHHHHHNSHAPEQGTVNGSSVDPSCASYDAAARGSAAATSLTTPTAASIAGGKMSPSVTGTSSTATPADRSATASGGMLASNPPDATPTGGDLAAARMGAAGLSASPPQQQQQQEGEQQQQQQQQQPRQLRSPQGPVQERELQGEGQEEQGAAAVGREAAAAARAGRSADVQGLATKLEVGTSDGGAEPAVGVSTPAAAAATEEAAVWAEAAAGGGIAVASSAAGGGAGTTRNSAPLDGGLGI